MFQKKFVTILLVAAAATIAVLAAPAVGGTTLGLAAREPEVYERALAFEGAPLQTREVDAATDFAERSIDDAIDLEQREETDGVELEEREFDDELEERSFEDGVELDEREVADAVELYEQEELAAGSDNPKPSASAKKEVWNYNNYPESVQEEDVAASDNPNPRASVDRVVHLLQPALGHDH